MKLVVGLSKICNTHRQFLGVCELSDELINQFSRVRENEAFFAHAFALVREILHHARPAHAREAVEYDTPAFRERCHGILLRSAQLVKRQLLVAQCIKNGLETEPT